ncbi:MAG TPA: hypothetical protein VMT42_01015 [candidate division Zixibacteria bacterium]|nr:hypothetical protein [candidate division Zixibacteria bacterium]
MEKEAKAKMHLSRRKKIALVALILVILASLEVYAHTYVQIRSLPVVTVDEAMHSLPFENNTGTYVFSSAGCQWLIVWKADEASTSMNYGYISIFKVEQNRSLFTLNTDLVVARLDPTSNHTGWLDAALDEVLYENNRTDASIRYYFGEIDTYQIDFGLVVRVYEETLLATLLREEIRIPLETTIYYGPP